MKIGAVHRHFIGLLSDQAPLALAVTLLVPVLASVPLARDVPTVVLFSWCSASAVVALFRFFLTRTRRSFAFDENEDNEVRSSTVYFLSTVLQGLVWGVGAVVLLNFATGFNQTLILIIVVGVSAGAIPVLGYLLSVYTGFLLSSTLPVVAWLVGKGEEQTLILSAIGCVFITVCYLSAKRFQGVLLQAVSSNDRASALAEKLSSSNEKLEDTVQYQRQVEKDLRERAKLEQVITTLSAAFVRLTVDEIDSGIDRALAKIGGFAQVDRSYVFLFGAENAGGKITHQWCAPDVRPRTAHGFYQLEYSLTNINKGRGSYITSSSKLPSDADAEREMFQKEGLKSWYAVPLIMDAEVCGFLGFDAIRHEVQWNQDIVSMLRLAGATLMNGLERKRVEGLMQHQAHHDPLTALPNRRLFMDHMERALQRCSRHGTKAAVLFLDVDLFKMVNDTLGHSAGDVLLKQMAERLQSGLRKEDIASRFGGDEFVVLLSDVSRQGVDPVQTTFSLANRVQNTLCDSYRINDQDLSITTSMGIAVFPGEGLNAEDIISNADAAMYRAKDSGRNVIQFYEQDTQHKAKARLQMNKDLQGSLSKDEFEFYSQSQVNSHGDVITDELLLRWNSPSLGIVESKNFLPLAIDTGLITQIDDWVLDNACSLIKRKKLTNRESNISYAINVSASQFHRKGFHGLVEQTLRKYGLSGGFLELELAEDVFMDDVGKLDEKMRGLRNLGIRFAVDDFGVGYSSLASLKLLPIDKIKIDMSFVQGADQNPTDAAVVEAVVGIAKNFELEIVAEGVETYAQLEFLQQQGVGLFQGHYFGEPRPIG